MYRIKKVLNHNTIIGIGAEDSKEYLLMGKGIGFGKKVAERVEERPEDTVYSLQEMTDRGNAADIIKSVSPECLELANEILNEAEKEFGKLDRSILFPIADHIAFAIKRIRNGEQISNPLTDDIRVLFYKEYKVAECMHRLLDEQMQMEIDEHEIGYIALHIHSAIVDEKVSQAMQVARAVRECISLVEEQTNKKIDVVSLSYNRLMNHVRYMVARVLSGEKLKVNMNEYMEIKFPDAFRAAEHVCREIGKSLHVDLEDVEVGYLAMHIERVLADEISGK